MFFVISISLFPLGGGADTDFLSGIASGVIWVTALLAIMFSMDSLFRADYEDGSLEQLLMSPQPLYFAAAGQGLQPLAAVLSSHNNSCTLVC